MSDPACDVAFPPLQGSSLLGFLAALGAFRALGFVHGPANVRLRWAPAGSSYCPVVHLPAPTAPGALVQGVHGALAGVAGHYVLTADKDLKIPAGRFRKLAARAVDDFLAQTDAEAAGMVAGFGCDAVTNDDGTIQDTGFRTMSGAGHQHFLEFMNLLAKETTAGQVHEALFGPWRYRDPSPTLRWDAEDDRRYALRWDQPATDPVRTVRGANLLAMAALPLFPVVPLAHDTTATTGFAGRGSRDTFITWPLWTGWLTIDAVRSLLAFKEVLKAADPSALEPYGIAARYRSQRITLGKYRNFTPAAAC